MAKAWANQVTVQNIERQTIEIRKEFKKKKKLASQCNNRLATGLWPLSFMEIDSPIKFSPKWNRHLGILHLNHINNLKFNYISLNRSLSLSLPLSLFLSLCVSLSLSFVLSFCYFLSHSNFAILCFIISIILFILQTRQQLNQFFSILFCFVFVFAREFIQ